MSTKIIGISYNGVDSLRAEKLIKLCESYGFKAKVAQGKPTDEFYQDCEVIFGNPSPKSVSSYKNLKWLQTGSAGVDAYCQDGVVSDDTYLTNAKGGYGIGIAEHMMMQLLMVLKNSIGYYNNQNAQKWESLGKVRGLYGSVVTVVGLGDIGGEFAKRVSSFGAVVRGVKRIAEQKPDFVDELYSTQDLDKALEGADVVALCLPNTPSTDNILNSKRIENLKSGCVIINVGRGSAIDEQALIERLNSGDLGGACLDVAKTEPLPESNPLWTAKNCIITPHVSGGVTLDLTVDKVISVFTNNLKNYAEGKAFDRVVNRKECY